VRRFVWLSVVLLLAGCHYRPEPVPLHGESTELRRLAGKWNGYYIGAESGRSGSITFEVTASADSAFGDVLLTVPGNWGAVSPVDLREAHLAHASSAQMLNVQFVRMAGSRVRGTLEPYRAPDCNCVVRTVFTGAMIGDTIRGTFITVLGGGAEQHGTWRVTRARTG
jgi:hypothetical protein